jgi:hexosaminidase
MKLFLRNALLFTMVIAILYSCDNKPINAETNLIPKPDQIEFKSGQFDFPKQVLLKYSVDHTSEAELLKEYLADNGIELNNDAKQVIAFAVKKDLPKNAYLLNIRENSIALDAGNDNGLKYGIQTLRQLFFYARLNNEGVHCQVITNAPNYNYRGMHLDVARHFMPVEFVKQYIDMMAMLKMNYFHWHLVDDQGWRIEIKKYPKLTEVGSKRKETLIGHGGRPPFEYDGKPHEGFYTQEEIKDIVAYAQKRGITIIPEIEMPGHAQSAIASYPELGVTGEKIDVWTRWGVSPYIYNVEESTFEFLEGVLIEVAELFPGKYIHIGGDEAVKDQWKASARIQQRMKELGVKTEADLQSYFIKRIADFLRSKNKTIVGWDEILEGGAPEDAIVTYWRSWVKPSPALEAAEHGHKVIFTPASLCYFDHYQTTLKDSIEPPAIGGCTPVDSLYIKNPVKNDLPADLKNMVWGAQGNVWTEYMKTPDHVEHMVMPRMAALAEVLWTDEKEQDFDDFKRRFKLFSQWLETKDINYADYIF